jgi:DNA-binding NtrC family response regulator
MRWSKTMDERLRIMVVDDELIVRESLYHWFKKAGHMVEAVSSGNEALDILEKEPFEVLFVDMKMPRMNGLELLKRVKEGYPDAIVIIITAYGSIESSVEAMKLGASDYLLKPFKPDQLALVLEKIARERKLTSEYHYVKGILEEITRFDNMIGQSPPMTAIFELIPKVAQSESSVLISGETGTGKELVAKAIHAGSLRSKGPFIAMNCGALPDALLESELFGHQKGAFTGANQARKGFLEVASGGTLFLDEIGEISPKMQVDLLRVLEEKKIIRIGDREPIDVDFRLLSSTRRDLDEEVAAGRFREDLLYRINVITLHIPPLRKRKGDILLLVDHFLNKYSHETAKQVDRVTPEAVEFLKSYDWPGNVRELENAIERAVVLSKSRTLGIEDFSFIRPSPVQYREGRTLKEMEKDYIQAILEEQDWNITVSAKILGVNRVSLHKIINRYQLKRPP